MKRFWDKVDVRGIDDCWEWKASCTHRGYGYFFWEKKLHHAHRVSFLMHQGRWPEPCCMHSCDNRKCVNPAHLFEGTAAQNSGDMVAKGRSCRGSKQSRSVLTEQDVRDIRANYALCRVTQRELASRYGLSCSAITNAINGNNWSHV